MGRFTAATVMQSILGHTKARDSASQGASGSGSPNPLQSLQTLPVFGKKKGAPSSCSEF